MDEQAGAMSRHSHLLRRKSLWVPETQSSGIRPE
jgi:hypothetical protein